jgi:hypothetical protein
MPLFHFDVRFDRADWSDDDEGVELRDTAEARDQAFDLARGLAKEHIDGNREITIRVRDGHPEPVVTLRLSLSVDDRASARADSLPAGR